MCYYIKSVDFEISFTVAATTDLSEMSIVYTYYTSDIVLLNLTFSITFKGRQFRNTRCFKNALTGFAKYMGTMELFNKN